MLTRIAWACWAILPVVAMAYHFGPGQRDLRQDDASRMLQAARQAEAEATEAQAAAHAAQLETIEGPSGRDPLRLARGRACRRNRA